MYRKIVWHGTVLVTDIKEMFQLVLEYENTTDGNLRVYVQCYTKKRRYI